MSVQCSAVFQVCALCVLTSCCTLACVLACAAALSHEQAPVANFSSSFADGLAFCAIVHRFRPALLPDASYASWTRHERFKRAFEGHFSHLTQTQYPSWHARTPTHLHNHIRARARAHTFYSPMQSHGAGRRQGGRGVRAGRGRHGGHAAARRVECHDVHRNALQGVWAVSIVP